MHGLEEVIFHLEEMTYQLRLPRHLPAYLVYIGIYIDCKRGVDSDF